MNLALDLAAKMGFSPSGIAQMHQAALRVLHEIGMAVDNPAALQALAEAGVRVADGRAFFQPQDVEARLAGLQAVWAARHQAQNGGVGADGLRPEDRRLTISVGDMCQYYHNPHTDAIELMTTANLIEACRSVESLRQRGLGSYVPGVPRDVPPQLQAILEFRIGAEFLTDGPTLDTIHPPEALEYLFEMSAALGTPMRATNVFPVSPLRLSGYEFDLAVSQKDRWQEFYITTYPAAGVSAPVRFRAAWVLSLAEALGGMAIMHIIGGGKPVWFSVGMFPFDLRTLTIVGGMPECAWMFWARAQLNRFYDPAAGYSMMLGSQAKRPGLQAGLEKGMAGALGVLTGCDDLHYIGVLSFDDIFSPEQMVADCELRDALEQLRRGIPPDDPEDWLAAIRQGLERGYVQADDTLDHYRESYWFPRLFDRLSWHTFQRVNGKTSRQRARAELLDRLASYQYRPPAQAIQEVRCIFRRAWQHLGGDPQAEYLPLLYNE
jgi:trimethylamine--corrinoid protein Co-methyltransferase